MRSTAETLKTLRVGDKVRLVTTLDANVTSKVVQVHDESIILESSENFPLIFLIEEIKALIPLDIKLYKSAASGALYRVEREFVYTMTPGINFQWVRSSSFTAEEIINSDTGAFEYIGRW